MIGDQYAGNLHRVVAGQGVNWQDPSVYSGDINTNTNALKKMIAMRLHLKEGYSLPFEFLEVHKHGSEARYTVFVVANDKPVQIEDGELFPSDTLITQLRLLAKGETK